MRRETPPRDSRPTEALVADLVSSDEAVRQRVAAEIEQRIIERVGELMGKGLPKAKVKLQLRNELRHDLRLLSPARAPLLVKLAEEHDDLAGLLPFTGDDSFVRCVGSILTAWGPLAGNARQALRELESHESERLRILARDALRSIEK